MKTATVEEIAYYLKDAKKNNGPAPIFFLGAGASKTGGIPLANEIVEDILEKYSNNPRIKALNAADKTYPKLMECLNPNERNKLLKSYIDAAKINVTHIYLAHLMIHGYADYVLTVNFDNLILKALALFNEIAPTYDMAILKDLTTSTFKKKSIVFLHGQHHGLWLLNTKEEMEKVRTIIPRIFDVIKNERLWVFIGYSGEDPIFQHIKELGRFDNGLYWVTYKDNDPNPMVCNDLLDKSNKNAFLVTGYDADSFMLKLNTELDLPQPEIIDRPFSSVQSLLNNIVDIDDDEHFTGVKIRLEIAKRQVKEAIKQFDEKKIEPAEKVKRYREIDTLKKEIIDLIIKEQFHSEKIESIERRVESIKNDELEQLMANLLFHWANNLWAEAIAESGADAESFYMQAIEKLQKATALAPDDHVNYYNWGSYLGELARTKNGAEAESLYTQAFEKLQKATDLKQDYESAYHKWGIYLGELARIKTSVEAEPLYTQAFRKLQKATEIRPKNRWVYDDWGIYLGELARIKSGTEAESLYLEAFEKFQISRDFKSHGIESYEGYRAWGIYLGELARIKNSAEAEYFYLEAIGKLKKATEILPIDYSAYTFWGIYLMDLARIKTGEEAKSLLTQALEKFEKSRILGGGTYGTYHIACAYAMNSEKEKAFSFLKKSLDDKEIDVEHVKSDRDWKRYLDDKGFKEVIGQFEMG